MAQLQPKTTLLLTFSGLIELSRVPLNGYDATPQQTKKEDGRVSLPMQAQSDFRVR